MRLACAVVAGLVVGWYLGRRRKQAEAYRRGFFNGATLEEQVKEQVRNDQRAN